MNRNWETQTVVNWWLNDEATESFWQRQAEDCDSVGELADQMRDESYNEVVECVGDYGLFADLLKASLHEVDWQDVAAQFWTEPPETDEEPEVDDD